MATERERALQVIANEALARAAYAEEKLRKVAAMFGVPDGGQYLNDWKERADRLSDSNGCTRHGGGAHPSASVGRSSVGSAPGPASDLADSNGCNRRLINALDAIARTPEPLNNKNSALTQCEYLKRLAADALADSNGCNR
jgi:hypothetical protein